MNIQQNISLKSFNTFGIDQNAEFFLEVSSISELKDALKWAEDREKEVLILGGGSNILLTQDLDLLVILNRIQGVKLIREDEKYYYVEVGAGENWHEFVMRSLEEDWFGLENLSLIPGTVGASPMQNIGAYGVEIKEVFHELKALNRSTHELEIFDTDACKFGYRESVFKKELKGKYIICTVTFKLFKEPIFSIAYGAIQEVLDRNNIKKLSSKAISDAVIEIRKSKLPDPKEIGNSGSFFKNPTIPETDYLKLKEKFSEIPGYQNESGVKIPAAWLIEQTGWKGKRFGNIGVHEKQALVLVNFGDGKGHEIQKLSQKIQDSVQEKFGIALHPEVNFI